ncbi:metallophosphoesterase [Agarivorans albus]|uniref:Periplasmic alpha-amylase n=1 Tax=Agarivorans albus MKT 106 TaxID=1331007 RepID=R9PH34_AGAAL|nr:metallophosphoesterase [Agarivorans albus]GAD00704.1 periplasmic alpha-amylase [Agarivorans albus MKT 106]
MNIPQQQIAKTWRLAFGLATLLSISAASAHTWQFRGTPNNWQNTALTQITSQQYQTCQTFSTTNPRFKIDRYGDWSESYPAQDYLISQTGSYQISFNSQSHAISLQAVSHCDHSETTSNSEFRLYFDAQDFSNPPSIWAWISNGSAISELQGHTWNNQPNLAIDPNSGYYYWDLPSQYQSELASGLKLNFILNKNDEFSRNEPGCYSGHQWYPNLEDCINKPFKPYIGPYLSLLTPSKSGDYNTATVLDPATNMVVNYELAQANSNFTAVVYYRSAGTNQWLEQTEDQVAPLADDLGKVHHITLTQLTPNTEYQYKVLGPNAQLSQQYSFTTAKTTMNYSRFLVIGDMQDEQGEQRWHDIAQAIAADHMDDFDFIITVGDMVKDDVSHSDERFYWWKVFFDKGQQLFSSKPILPAMGNHDTPGNHNVSDSEQYWSNPEDTRSFRKYFYLSPDMSDPDYYSFQYGSACFISVNSEIPVFYGRHPERDNANNAATQASWLEQEVNKAQACPWSFAYWHVPAINPAGGKSEVEFVRPYTDYFNQKLDWSITGHVHEYQRLKPVYATQQSLDFNKTGYGRAANQGVGYMIAAPAGQWPRNTTSNNMNQLAFYPHNSNGTAYEIGFTIINVSANNFELKTYGMGSVGNKVQPAGYRPGDDRSKQLLDAHSYSKPALTADAGADIQLKLGDSVTFNASGSQAFAGEIVSYQWSNGLSGQSATTMYTEPGSFAITLTITDSLGNQANDTLIVTVHDPQTSFGKDFNGVDFRGTANGWGNSAMSLIADNTWQILVNIEDTNNNPRFKFYANDKWYGDSNNDGETHSNESSSIKLTQGAGLYQITLTDNTRKYQINKL